jgi:putative transcriptional regulator
MTIEHHPSDVLLAAFAAGTLDLGQHVAVATHLAGCAGCRGFVRAIEEVGGDLLDRLPPGDMTIDALSRVEARFGAFAGAAEDRAPAVRGEVGDMPGLPHFVRNYRFESWKWVAPKVHVRPIRLPEASDTRVFLLKSGPGTKMLPHSHTGVEMTCVLSGAFRHEGGYFGPGDFDLGDESIEHEPAVEAADDCICLVAMQGRLQLNGFIGRLIQPFVRL